MDARRVLALWAFVGIKVGGEQRWNNLALRKKLKNLHTKSQLSSFLLPVAYFPTNLVYPFTLRVTGIITTLKNVCIQKRYYS